MRFHRNLLFLAFGIVMVGAFVAPLVWGQGGPAPSRSTFPVLDAPPVSNQTRALRQQGKVVYDRYCVGCHGVQGDGNGPAAPLLVVKPRDFTKGVYKFRSTPSGTLPTDDDLYRIITRGIYGTAMPQWSLVSERNRLAVIEYIKAFYPDWKKRGAGTPIYVPEPPPDFGSAAAVTRGREIYDFLGCATCHGETGRGDGPSAATLDPDIWGNKQRPFDFTKGQLRGGPTIKDVYRTFMTGVGGTAMPSYADIFSEPDGEYIKEGDAWNLVSYIISLRRRSQTAATNQRDRGETQ